GERHAGRTRQDGPQPLTTSGRGTRPGPPPRRRTAMNTIHDETREMLRDYMTGALGRVITGLDALDELPKIAGRMADRDDWEALSEGVRDVLVDLGVEPDD